MVVTNVKYILSKIVQTNFQSTPKLLDAICNKTFTKRTRWVYSSHHDTIRRYIGASTMEELLLAACLMTHHVTRLLVRSKRNRNWSGLLVHWGMNTVVVQKGNAEESANGPSNELESITQLIGSPQEMIYLMVLAQTLSKSKRLPIRVPNSWPLMTYS